MTFNCKTGPLGSFGAFVGTVALAGVLPAVTIAQNYSIEGANPYFAREDSCGLMAYTQAGSRSKPNDPMAWYYMGQTYGTGLNQSNVGHVVTVVHTWLFDGQNASLWTENRLPPGQCVFTEHGRQPLMPQ